MVPAEVRPAPDRSHGFDSLPPESNDFSWRVGRARLKRRRGRMLSRERPSVGGLGECGADAVAVGPGSARPIVREAVVLARQRGAVGIDLVHERSPFCATTIFLAAVVTNKGSMSGGKEKKRPGRRPRRSFYGAGPVGVSAGGSGAGDSTSADPSSTIAASSSASIASSSPSSSSRLVPSISASIAGISSDVETTP